MCMKTVSSKWPKQMPQMFTPKDVRKFYLSINGFPPKLDKHISSNTVDFSQFDWQSRIFPKSTWLPRVKTHGLNWLGIIFW